MGAPVGDMALEAVLDARSRHDQLPGSSWVCEPAISTFVDGLIISEGRLLERIE